MSTVHRVTTLSFFVACLCSGASTTPAVLSVHLQSNVAAPQPVGTVIGLSPKLDNASRDVYVTRYSVREEGGDFRVIRDFSQDPGFQWRPALYEHNATVRVTVRDNKTKATAEADLPFQVVSRVKGSDAIATPTFNPLVALFSAPACKPDSRFRAGFQRV